MMRFDRPVLRLVPLALLWAASVVASGAAWPAAPSAPERPAVGGGGTGEPAIAAFMAMKVCERDGTVDPAAAPGDAACRTMRALRPGEAPPYFLTNVAGPSTRCPDGGGPIAKVNVPVARAGVVRIVSVYSHRAADTGCSGPSVSDKVGASIQWHDDGYGFIMGSWSPVGLSNFISPACRDGGGDSRRFFRGWVIGPADAGPPGAAVFDSALAVGAAGTATGCPARFHHGYTAWRTVRFRFTSGLDTEALISDHYANAAPGRVGPGPAEQFERTYWTREFGLTRWEKWARDDWTNPRSGIGAVELAARLDRTGSCDRPWQGSGREAPGLERVAAPPGGAPAAIEVHEDPDTGERHDWSMTLCDDYSHVVHRTGVALQREAEQAADPAYWQ